MTKDPTSGMLTSLSLLDRLLPVWIFVAMGVGVVIGYTVPQIGHLINSFKFTSVSLPIAVGLIWMMYPPLAAVKYRNIGRVVTEKKMMSLSLVLNWSVAPFLMFVLALVFLPDLPLFRDGVME